MDELELDHPYKIINMRTVNDKSVIEHNNLREDVFLPSNMFADVEYEEGYSFTIIEKPDPADKWST